jgi:hypothetical protein
MTTGSTCGAKALLATAAALPLGVDQSRRPRWKQRYSPAGLHLFDRNTGLNILLDEISVPSSRWSRAPRHVSIALTNRCDSTCQHCFAPKSSDELRLEVIKAWLAELDANGTLGVGFGGGEPTLHPDFVRLCQDAARETQLSVTFTTHGHHVDEALAERLQGSVHFVRVSMDGVGATYESIRRRPFCELLSRLKIIQTICRFGINIVVNERTLAELEEVAAVAADAGACELLLLPQMPTPGCDGIDSQALQGLRRWVDAYQGSLRLCINEGSAEGFPTCNPFKDEHGLRAYAHVDAAGVLKPISYRAAGIVIAADGIMGALDSLGREFTEMDT